MLVTEAVEEWGRQMRAAVVGTDVREIEEAPVRADDNVQPADDPRRSGTPRG
jgi:hypothetical protein